MVKTKSLPFLKKKCEISMQYKEKTESIVSNFDESLEGAAFVRERSKHKAGDLQTRSRARMFGSN